MSETVEPSSKRSKVETGDKQWRGTKHKRQTPQYKFSNFVKEQHKKNLFGVAFNYHAAEGSPLLVATVGSNRATVYECDNAGSLTPIRAYADAEANEDFYTCAWSHDSAGEMLLAVAGARGVIRIIYPGSSLPDKTYTGHGNAINELKFHPKDPSLLLSVAKDHALRLWNIETDTCVAIFGGVDGHRDEVLSGDFDLTGSWIMSCGMDHALKLWSMNDVSVLSAIRASKTYQPQTTNRSFDTLSVHFPVFTTRKIHCNYVDCVRWFGQLVLSKSCDNTVSCWKPGSLTDTLDTVSRSTTDVSVVHRFDYTQCDIWYMRFCINYEQTLLAVGNQVGKVFVWDLLDVDPTKPRSNKPAVLSHPKCTTAVRQTAFSQDGSVLVCVCDDGSVWRWDRKKL
ncbi:polycomb protein EED-like [Sycon ciliatum]|uniref:polycomb protein EED-like n=1 Tax=Sycon ciliatum TaxID=27933 RepID=UPI0031F5F7D4